MSAFEVGQRVRVAKVIVGDLGMTAGDEYALARIGQEGTVTCLDAETIFDHQFLVRFDEPDEDGDHDLSFSEDELEAVQ